MARDKVELRVYPLIRNTETNEIEIEDEPILVTRPDPKIGAKKQKEQTAEAGLKEYTDELVDNVFGANKKEKKAEKKEDKKAVIKKDQPENKKDKKDKKEKNDQPKDVKEDKKDEKNEIKDLKEEPKEQKNKAEDACSANMVLDAQNHPNDNVPSDVFAIRKALDKDKDLQTAVDQYFRRNRSLTANKLLEEMQVNNGVDMIQRMNPKNMREHTQQIRANNNQMKK